MSSSEERRRIESFSVAKPSSYPRDATIPALFEEQVALRPEAIALEAGNLSLTYAELNSRANRLARYLKNLGVGPEAVVGLAVERSPEMIVGLLGILKAGGAYLPLDPDLPGERRDLMIRETGAKWVVEPSFLDECARESEESLELRAKPDSLAYVLYTSGSTGAPKGVEVVHRAVARLVKNPGYVDLGPEETLAQLAPISCDASTFEIWGALLNGAKLAVFPSRPSVAPSLANLGRFSKSGR
jgi:non-ribosomal peptide synthetase component F